MQRKAKVHQRTRGDEIQTGRYPLPAAVCWNRTELGNLKTEEERSTAKQGRRMSFAACAEMRAVRVDVPSHVSVSDMHADMSFLLFRLSIFFGARRAGFLPKFWIFGVGSGVWECAMCHDGVWMGCACAWARFLFLWVLNIHIHTPTPRTYLRTPGSHGPRSPGRRSSGSTSGQSFCRLMQYM